jgi:hypothetical protein
MEKFAETKQMSKLAWNLLPDWFYNSTTPEYKAPDPSQPGLTLNENAQLVPTPGTAPEQKAYWADPSGQFNKAMFSAVPKLALGAVGTVGAAVLFANLLKSIQRERARTSILRDSVIKLPILPEEKKDQEKTASDGLFGLVGDVSQGVKDIWSRDFGAENPNMLTEGLLFNSDGWKYYVPALAALGLTVPAASWIANSLEKRHWNDQLNQAREEYVKLMKNENQQSKNTKAASETEMTDLDWFDVLIDDSYEQFEKQATSLKEIFSGATDKVGDAVSNFDPRQVIQGAPGLYLNSIILASLLGGGLAFGKEYDKTKKERLLFLNEMRRMHTNQPNSITVQPIAENEDFKPVQINKLAALLKISDDGRSLGQRIGDGLAGAVNTVGNVVSAVSDPVGTLDAGIDHSMQRVKDQIPQMGKMFGKSVADSVGDQLPPKIQEISKNEGVQSSLADLATGFGGKLVDSVSTGIKNKVSDLGQMAMNGLQSAGQMFGNGASDFFKALTGSYQGMTGIV